MGNKRKDPTLPLNPSAAYCGVEVLKSSGFRKIVLSTCMRPGSSEVSTGFRGGGQKEALSIQGGLEFDEAYDTLLVQRVCAQSDGRQGTGSLQVGMGHFCDAMHTPESIQPPILNAHKAR